jgi:hypothetical protein
MKPTDTFASAESITYDTQVGSISFTLSESTIEELSFLVNLGYYVTLSRGRVFLEGDDSDLSRLLADEVENLALDNDELRDYLQFHSLPETEIASEIGAAIFELATSKPYDLRIIDVFEHIQENWILSTREKKELKKQEAEYFQEKTERNYQ